MKGSTGRFGVGLSPLGSLESFDEVIKQALLQRLRLFDEIGVQDMTIQFDDAPGDVTDPVAREIRM